MIKNTGEGRCQVLKLDDQSSVSKVEGFEQGLEAVRKPNIVPFERADTSRKRIS